MIVYDLKAEELNMHIVWMAHMMRKKDYYLTKTKILLDPYAQAVAGQQAGERKEQEHTKPKL